MADHSDTGQRPVPGALFSMEAADNAEVVPADLPRGPEAMWSTRANPEEAHEVADAAADRPPPAGAWSGPSATARSTEPLDDDAAWAQMGSSSPPGTGRSRLGRGFGVGEPVDPWDRADLPPTAPGAPGAGGVFSAEPVERLDDVVDEGEVDGELEEDWVDSAPGPSLFSNGSPAGDVDGTQRSGGAGGARASAPFGDAAQAGAASHGSSPFATPSDPWSRWEPPAPPTEGSVHAPPPFVPPAASAAGTAGSERRGGEDPAIAIAPDQHGLDVAVSRLRVEDQERARVPLSVCGALLEPGEQVLGAVTGQMLGRPAAVVVTRERVLVANDRRWQPIVDIYPIDDSLLVRGRHDRQVAALSFADDVRLSMVDGITDVEIAIGLAEAIRDPGTPDRGSGAAF